MYGFYYADSGFLLVIGAIVIGLVANALVKRTFDRFSKVPVGSGISGSQAARAILDSYGLVDVEIERAAGRMSDHYDPRSRTLRLSSSVHSGSSVSAVGVAAHEAGHAVQHAQAYAPFGIRSRLVPVASLGSQLLFPLMFAGIFFGISGLFTIGAILYGGALLFHLVTLPVEFDASRRAVAHLQRSGMVTADELSGVKRVLGAAAMTYVAAALASLAYMARLLLLGRRR